MYPSRGGRGKPHFLSIHTTRFRRLGTNRNPVTEAVSLESYLLYAVSVNNRIVCANNLRIYHCEVLVSRPQTFGRTLKAYGHTAKGAVKLTSSIGSRCLRKKHGLVNRHGDTLAFLKGWTLVNREMLTNKVNQLRRGMNNIDSVHSLYKSGEGCGIHVSEGGFLELRPSWRPELNCGQLLKSSCRLE